MPETPGKRGREDDKEGNGNFLTRLFSAKKQKRSRDVPVENATSPTATTMPRLNFSPSYNRPSEQQQERQTTVTFAVQEERAVGVAAAAPAAATTRQRETPFQQRRPAAQSIMPPPTATATAAPSPWRGNPIRFSIGTSSSPLVRQRRPTYRPNSRTLVPNRRRRPLPKEYNNALIQSLLNQAQSSFKGPTVLPAVTTAPGQRRFGTHQTGSRLRAPAAAARKAVTFQDTRNGTTPSVSRRTGHPPRNGTPYALRHMDVSMEEEEDSPAIATAPPVNVLTDEFGHDLPPDYESAPRLAESPNADIDFDTADEFADTTERRGTLVAGQWNFLDVDPLNLPPLPDPRVPTTTNTDAPHVEEASVFPPTNEEETSPVDTEPQQKKAKTTGWGDTFVDLYKGMWKCSTCSSHNSNELNVCASCQTPRDGDGGGETSKEAAPSAAGSIGAGGFTFATSDASASFPSAKTPTPFTFGEGNKNSAEGATSAIVSDVLNAPKSEDSTSSKNESSKRLSFGSNDGDAAKPPAAPQVSIGGCGFSFGNQDSASAKPFSFGASSSSSSPKPQPADDTKEDEEKKDDDSKPRNTSLFGGSAKATPGGFSFGSKKPSEGDSTSTTAPAPFSFATKSSDETKVTTVTSPDESDTKDKATTDSVSEESKTPGFSFGTKPAAPKSESTVKKPGFSFGGPSSSTTPATEGNELNFGTTDKPAADSSAAMGPPPNKPFQFGSAATPAPDSAAATAASFPFGTSSAATTSTPAPATDTATPSVSFAGSSGPSATNDSAAQSGKKKRRAQDESAQPPAAPSLSFGGSATPAADASSMTSQFGSAASTAPAPAAGQSSGFVFGQTQASSTPAPAPAEGQLSGFVFGQSAAGSTPSVAAPAPAGSQSSSFTFGQASASNTVAPASAAPPSTGFAFGNQAASTNPPSFGQQTNDSEPATPSIGFGQNGGSNPFGSNTSSAAPAPAMPFGTSSTQASASGPVPFNFGTSPAVPSTFGTAAPPAASSSAQQPGGFPGFGSTTPAQAPPATNSFSAPGASSTSFNFGATTTTTSTPAPGGGFGSGGFGSSNQPTAPAPAAQNGFVGGGFGTASTPNAPPTAAGGGFSIGSAGAPSTGPRGRRIIRARRPPGSARR